MAEDGHVGVDGLDGGVAAGMKACLGDESRVVSDVFMIVKTSQARTRSTEKRKTVP